MNWISQAWTFISFLGIDTHAFPYSTEEQTLMRRLVPGFLIHFSPQKPLMTEQDWAYQHPIIWLRITMEISPIKIIPMG